MRHKKGLTLVETVVVIAVGLFSVSVMIPGLDQRRDAARKTLCMSNIRALTAGVYAYAQLNDNYVPSTTNVMNAAWNNWIYAWSLGWTNPDGSPQSAQEGWVGLGELCSTGLINEGSTFFCPSQEHPALDPDIYFPAQTFPGYEGLLPKTFTPVGCTARGSLMYGLAGQVDDCDNSDRPVLEMQTLRLPYARQKVLVSDMFIPLNNYGVYQSSFVHGNGLNVGYVDGHVDFVQVDQQVVDLANQQRAYDADSISLHRADLFAACMLELLAGDPSYMEKYFGIDLP